MRLTQNEKIFFENILKEFHSVQDVYRMKECYVHGGSSVYEHSLQVACMSYWFACRLPVRVDKASLVRGALLHDFYLYDWHTGGPGGGVRHGVRHAAIALENARRWFLLNEKEENIILSHMWPLTIRKLPKSREAVLVNLADKLCAAREDVCNHILRRPAYIAEV